MENLNQSSLEVPPSNDIKPSIQSDTLPQGKNQNIPTRYRLVWLLIGLGVLCIITVLILYGLYSGKVSVQSSAFLPGFQSFFERKESISTSKNSIETTASNSVLIPTDIREKNIVKNGSVNVTKLVRYTPLTNNFPDGSRLDTKLHPEINYQLSKSKNDSLVVVEFKITDYQREDKLFKENPGEFFKNLWRMRKEAAIIDLNGEIDPTEPVFVKLSSDLTNGYVVFSRPSKLKNFRIVGRYKHVDGEEVAESQEIIDYVFFPIELYATIISVVDSGTPYNPLEKVNSQQAAGQALDDLKGSRPEGSFLSGTDCNEEVSKELEKITPNNNEELRDLVSSYAFENCKLNQETDGMVNEEVNTIKLKGFNDLNQFKKDYVLLKEHIDEIKLLSYYKSLGLIENYIIGLQEIEKKYKISVINKLFKIPQKEE